MEELTLTLGGFLVWLMSAAGATAVTVWGMDAVPWLKAQSAEARRYLSLAIAAVLPVLAWLATLGLGYSEAPVTWQGWMEAVFALAAPSIVASQGLHGALRLRGKTAEAARGRTNKVE